MGVRSTSAEERGALERLALGPELLLRKWCDSIERVLGGGSIQKMCGPSACIDVSQCKTMKLDGSIMAVKPFVGAKVFLVPRDLIPPSLVEYL